MKTRILEILKDLMDIRKTTDLRITDDTLFEQACSCYRGEMAGKSKNYQSTPPKTPSGTSDKPTAKQIAFLTKQKVQVPPTKKLATQMIKNYIENQKKENI